MALEKNITWKKKERGSNIIFLIILRLLGRISSGEEEGNFGKENQDFKNEVREEYQLIGNFIHPLLQSAPLHVLDCRGITGRSQVSAGDPLPPPGSCPSGHQPPLLLRQGETTRAAVWCLQACGAGCIMHTVNLLHTLHPQQVGA